MIAKDARDLRARQPRPPTVSERPDPLGHEKGPPAAALSWSSGGGTRTHNLPVNSRTRLPVELPRTELPRFIGRDKPGLHFSVAVRAQ